MLIVVSYGCYSCSRVRHSLEADSGSWMGLHGRTGQIIPRSMGRGPFPRLVEGSWGWALARCRMEGKGAPRLTALHCTDMQCLQLFSEGWDGMASGL
jgi:hypothetical protein